MKLLIDTHVLLWWLNDDPKLPTRADVIISDSKNEVFVSSISLWEIAIKSTLGKLDADVNEIRETVFQNGMKPLPFTLEHAVAVAAIPLEAHRDPFDRALIAQAQYEPLHLLTHDRAMAAYGEPILFVE